MLVLAYNLELREPAPALSSLAILLNLTVVVAAVGGILLAVWHSCRRRQPPPAPPTPDPGAEVWAALEELVAGIDRWNSDMAQIVDTRHRPPWPALETARQLLARGPTHAPAGALGDAADEYFDDVWFCTCDYCHDVVPKPVEMFDLNSQLGVCEACVKKYGRETIAAWLTRAKNPLFPASLAAVPAPTPETP